MKKRKYLTFFWKIFHYNYPTGKVRYRKQREIRNNVRRVKNLEKLKQNPIVKKLGLNRILLACILVLMFVVFKVVLGSKFPVGDSIKSTLNLCILPGLSVTWSNICNCHWRNRFLHWTGNVLLCPDLRLLHDILSCTLCSSNGDLYLDRICIWRV